ncbi:cysteine-rich and transmembrane domain-containing protein 1 isoform X2 [Antechinus flavipes]|uniref:cysteine-rich and transmembrane domain-containing protein 1 isoform X2 n=1 Tax=Antechinus flavipes TaxID=38775 RepID=UPI002235F90A|nr:cysteine-rich and transmembrane domain-containing protein 1 isoform X2 [Antechinus flavipes]
MGANDIINIGGEKYPGQSPEVLQVRVCDLEKNSEKEQSERQGFHSIMNYGNPPPYSDPGPTAPYPPYMQQPGSSQAYPPAGPYPAGPPGPYPPPNTGYPYQGYPQYGWQGGPPPEAPKTTVFIEQRNEKKGCWEALAACWTVLCCCHLMDMLD